MRSAADFRRLVGRAFFPFRGFPLDLLSSEVHVKVCSMFSTNGPLNQKAVFFLLHEPRDEAPMPFA